MDLQVAVFLLIFLSISSLATIGICFVEIRSCWRNYRRRRHRKRHDLATILMDGSTNIQAVRQMEEIIAAVDESTALEYMIPTDDGSGSNGYNIEDEILGNSRRHNIYGEYPLHDVAPL